ncbi:UNVERIFIED_CONTAM: hypothetical protein FKN15_031464 [Acipenser sinensis]
MDFRELIERLNKNTAAQEEQTRKMERQRQELGLAPWIIQEREPTELELLLQKRELPSREPEGVELPSREPEGVELPSREPEGVELPSRETEGVELPLPEQPTVQVSPAFPVPSSWTPGQNAQTSLRWTLLPGRSTARHSRLPGPLLHSPWNPRCRYARGRGH